MEFSKIDCIGSKGWEKQLTVAAGPVIIKDSKIVLTREFKDDYWKFPGGKVKEGESITDTVKREALEEAGLKIKLFGDPIAYLLEQEKVNYLLVHYRAEVLEDFNVGSDENIAEINWFNISDISVKLAPNVIPVLNRFIQIQ